MRRIVSAGLASFLMCLFAACLDEASAPPEGAEAPRVQWSRVASDPTFLRLSPTAPPLVSGSVSFWAVQGQDREASIYYRRPNGGPPRNSDRLARFRVDKRSLVTAPDGSPLAPGDSVLITMTVVDPAHQVIEFQPAGLRFAPARPADLTIWYRQADHDFNGDGVIDRADAALESGFAIWQQEQSGDPWVMLSTILAVGLDQAETDVPGFTRFAVAY